MSMASENGSPRIISGALRGGREMRKKKRINLEGKYEVEWFKSFRTAGQPIRCLEEQSVEIN